MCVCVRACVRACVRPYVRGKGWAELREFELTRWYLFVSWTGTPGTAPSQCLVNVSVAEAGNCPVPNSYYNLFCTNLCGHDVHCPGALKCCYDGSCFRCMNAIGYNRNQYRNQQNSNQNQLNFNQNQLKSNPNQLNSNQNQQYKNTIQQYQNMIQRYQNQIPRSPNQRSLKNQNQNQQLTNQNQQLINQNQQQPLTAQFRASGHNSNTYRSLRDYQNMIQRYQNQLPPNPSQISSNQNQQSQNQNQQSQNQNQQQPRAAQSGATGYNINIALGSQRKYMYTHFGGSLYVAVWQFWREGLPGRSETALQLGQRGTVSVWRHDSWDREVQSKYDDITVVREKIQSQYDGITVGIERYRVSMTALQLV